MAQQQGFWVGSEVGRLRRVILHRPGMELKRLTPTNRDDLLFDEVLWVRRAEEEHDGFAAALRDRGVEVHYFADLLRETLSEPGARLHVLDSTFDERVYGRTSSAGSPSGRCSSASTSRGRWPSTPCRWTTSCCRR